MYDQGGYRCSVCLICEHKNAAAATMCAQCGAPMALIEDAQTQQRDPGVITLLGEANVGKTVYLGFLLDLLSKRAGGFEAIPKGAYSVNLQQSVIGTMNDRRFPAKTPLEVERWKWAYYQVRHREERKEEWFDVLLPDMAGEALSQEIETPRTYSVITNLLAKSLGVMVLIDASEAASGSPHPDYFAYKLISYVDQKFATKRDGRARNPIAVILCKADQCPECFDNPRAFAETNLVRMWNLCESRYENVEFFAASVVGSLGFAHDEDGNVVEIPLHAAPRGVLEPFEWIADRIQTFSR
jgi:hypothetical protein